MTAPASRVPPGIVVAIIVQLALVAFRIPVVLADKISWLVSPELRLLYTGIGIVTMALFASGAFELARRSAGRASLAARIAGALFTTLLVFELVGIGLDYLAITRAEGLPSSVYLVEGYAWTVLFVAGIGNLALAGARGRWTPIVIGLIVVAALALPPPALQALLREHGRIAGTLFTASARLVLFVGLLLHLRAHAAGLAAQAEDGATSEAGLRAAGSALMLRVFAAGALILVTLMAIGAGREALPILKLVTVSVPFVNVLSLGWFASSMFAVARGGLRGVPSYAFYAAGALSLWAAGAVCAQVPWIVRMTYGGDGYGSDPDADMIRAFAIVIPLVAATSIVVASVAIARFARQSNLDALRDAASSRAGSFVVLMFGSLAVQRFALPTAKGAGDFALWTLLAGGASLVAIVLVGRLCRDAADAVRATPGLPTATLL